MAATEAPAAAGSRHTGAGGELSSLPAWFKPEKFMEPDFNPEAYVNDLKRYVPLETLSADLQAHLSALKAKLVEVINDDYNDYVSLSTQLGGVDAAAARIQAPLQQLRGRLADAREGVAARSRELAAGLAKRQAVAAARGLLELMQARAAASRVCWQAQDAANVVAKVEKLLGELPPPPPSPSTAAGPSAGSGQAQGAAGAQQAAGAAAADGSSPEALEAQARLLDRVASEISRLQELAFMRELEPRVQSAAAQLQASLDATLTATLAAQAPAALATCMHAYAAIGRPAAAEAVVRRQLVAPAVAAGLGALAGGGGLPAALGAVRAALGAQVSPFLEHTLSQKGLEPFEFLGDAVLAQVHEAVAAAVPAAFSAGLPDAFHANLSAAQSFLDWLEGHAATAAQARLQERSARERKQLVGRGGPCAARGARRSGVRRTGTHPAPRRRTHAQVAAFRSSEALAAFSRRWNLSVYYSLRFQEIAGGLEAALPAAALDPAPPAVAGAPALAFAPSAAVWAALQRASAPDVFLPQLADRFLKLALQLVARYCSWVQASLAQRNGGQEGDGGAEPEPQQQDADAGGGGGAAAQAPAAAGGEDRGGGAAAAARPWAAAATPEQLAALWGDLDALASALLSSFQPRFAALLGGLPPEAVAAAAGGAASGADALRCAGAALLGAAAEGLVEQCVVVLKQLRGIVATFRMTNRAQARFVRKTESSLKRLKSRQQRAPEGGGDAAPQEDTDKMIGRQLFLDVQEFGRQAAAVGGLDPGGLQEFRLLWRTVAPPEQADAIQLP
eukprot:scaffold14.g1064.t1